MAHIEHLDVLMIAIAGCGSKGPQAGLMLQPPFHRGSSFSGTPQHRWQSTAARRTAGLLSWARYIAKYFDSAHQHAAQNPPAAAPDVRWLFAPLDRNASPPAWHSVLDLWVLRAELAPHQKAPHNHFTMTWHVCEREGSASSGDMLRVCLSGRCMM